MQSPIVALDFANRTLAEDFLANFDQPISVKVGMQLFYREGISFIQWLTEHHYAVFLDLKLYDIPHTVYETMKNLGQLDIKMTTVHAIGGGEMIQAAKKGLIDGASLNGTKPAHLLAVSELTSFSQQQMNIEQGIPGTIEQTVKHLTDVALNNGADGMVCSGYESKELAETFVNDKFLRVVPGIRLENDDHQDQKRVMTPKQARINQATDIVVGRSITQAPSVTKAYQSVLNSWQEGYNE